MARNPSRSAFSRRTVLKGAAAAAGALALPSGAMAQAAAPLRIGISLSDVPRMWGGPRAASRASASAATWSSMRW